MRDGGGKGKADEVGVGVLGGEVLGLDAAAGTGNGHSLVASEREDIWLVGVAGEVGAEEDGLRNPEAGEAGALAAR